MPDSSGHTDACSRCKSSDPTVHIEDVADALGVTDLDHPAGFREYCCANCNARCINPADSLIAEAGVCIKCRLRYLSEVAVGGDP